MLPEVLNSRTFAAITQQFAKQVLHGLPQSSRFLKTPRSEKATASGTLMRQSPVSSFLPRWSAIQARKTESNKPHQRLPQFSVTHQQSRNVTPPKKYRQLSLRRVADLNFPWLGLTFFKTCGLAGSFTKIEQLRAANASMSLHFDV